MQRATAITGRWAGALAFGSVLLFSVSNFPIAAHAKTADHASASAVDDAYAEHRESVLNRWHDYALASITPQFSWALPVNPVAPNVLDHYGARLEAPSRFSFGGSANTHISVSVATGVVGDTPSVMPSQAPSRLGVPQTGVERTVLTPSLVHNWGDGSEARLSAVLAYQRFASLGLGTSQWQDQILPPTFAATGNSSYGAGARLDLGGPISERLRWGVAYQSRVGMDAFKNYRGVFSDAGDFDIPASASAGLSYELTPALGVDIGAQRVMYSAITPFTSPTLPTRFLALLGDSSSPVFAWRDLTVYSLGWTLRDRALGNLELRYTTRQQPMPTSLLLAHALEPDTANDMVSLGWSRAIGTNSQMSFAASYASSPYLLLMPVYRSRDNVTASQLEFEAHWSVRF